VVKKPEQTQQEWAYQGEYREWSKRCASFNLPVYVKYLALQPAKGQVLPLKLLL
jgi:hypothetical protein